MSRLAKFIISGIGSFLSYILLYVIVTLQIDGGGASFFIGCGLAVLCGVIGVLIWFSLTKEKDYIMWLCLCVTCIFGCILFNTFGPTYVDRSVSYHMAFYVVDNGELDVDKMKMVYTEQMIDKRVEDELAAGMIEVDSDGKVIATEKAKRIVPVLKWIGELTGTLDEYEEFSREMEE